MAKSKTTWQKGQSGNPSGRQPGIGRIEEYRALLDPHVPKLLSVLVGKAKEGDMTALRLVLERVYPVRDAVVSDLMAEIEDLRSLLMAKKSENDICGFGEGATQ
jgi:hypothetical protein